MVVLCRQGFLHHLLARRAPAQCIDLDVRCSTRRGHAANFAQRDYNLAQEYIAAQATADPHADLQKMGLVSVVAHGSYEVRSAGTDLRLACMASDISAHDSAQKVIAHRIRCFIVGSEY